MNSRTLPNPSRTLRLCIFIVQAVGLLMALPPALARADGTTGNPSVSIEQYVNQDGTVDLDALRNSGQEGPVDLGPLQDRLRATDEGLLLGANDPVFRTRAENDENWAAGFAAPGCAPTTVQAVVIWNGQLVVGGGSGYFGGVAASLAAWNGSSWVDLGLPYGDVRALLVYDGDLIVASSRIYRYDGSTWTQISSGASPYGVYALAEYNGDLIAGGDYTAINGVAANYIARWDGSSWNPLGTGLDYTVTALTVYGTKLIAGGSFASAGGQAASRIAAWNGYVWSPLGTGANGDVDALAVYGSQLIAGGQFSSAGGQAASRVAAWNGTTWSPLGSGMAGIYSYVYSLAAHGALLIAGAAKPHRD
jgi:hypothetical protein